IEDYTAVQCINCPKAAQEAELMRATYPGRIVSIGVHVGSLSAPLGSTFPYDFRTTAGNNYDTQFIQADANGLPSGMIDRWFSSSSPRSQSDQTQWPSYVSTRLAAPDTVDLQITNSYNAGTLTSKVKVKFLTSHPSTYNLVALLTEDSIVSPQKDIDSTALPNSIVTHYMHRYSLRGAIDGNTSGMGNPVTGLVGDSTTTTFNYTMPPSFNGMVPNPNHCRVVAFIYDTNSGEILQTEEQKIN
ncbi:MAG TPA: Omp28-related outer membrane protein, partial [Bacteroidia bacterium]|nr:Omp28-related outer membrane protein [Bacteroidia bacterium]